MKADRKKMINKIFEDMLLIGALFVMFITALIMILAMFDKEPEKEAYAGSFEANSFNEDWVLEQEGIRYAVELPLTYDVKKGATVTLSNTLPDDVDNGMELLFKSKMQEVYIYVDGELRSSYTSEQLTAKPYYLPSTYLVADLSKEDAGKEIKIVVESRSKGVLCEIKYGNGNNAWFRVLKNGLRVNIIATVVLMMGIGLCVGSTILNKAYDIKAPRALSLLMIDVAFWVFSESDIRQFIFRRPSFSLYFAYLSVELMAVLSAMFVDEVQHKRYHKRYLIVEAAAFIQLIVNVVLHIAGIRELHTTISFSHIWVAACAGVTIASIVEDFIRKRAKEYIITTIAIIGFVIVSGAELVGFYSSNYRSFGSFVSSAMLILMIGTVAQTIYDEIKRSKIREKTRTAMAISTIETIAGAIDARDEYTGGHSERVGLYASRIAREMAADYDLTEEDILRVHYIGLVHDIGKIGVADNVLNKSGKLSEEEFSLMKKHSEIGYEIMSSMGDGIKGLLDGIKYHHERFDGQGYPDGLSDTDIPLIARVLALADSYDAMTSNRVYRKRLTDEQVREEFIKCSGTQFDPALTEIVLRLLDKGELKASTVEGLDTDENGDIRVSSLLETRLQVDMHERKDISNPAHVRMLCYIIKLMEKKGKKYTVFFVGTNDDTDREGTWKAIRESVRASIGPHDVNIKYTRYSNVVALYDANDERIRGFIAGLKKTNPETGIEWLTEDYAEKFGN